MSVLLSLALLVCAVVFGPQPELTPLTPLLLLAYLGLELTSPSLPLVGRFSAGPGLLVAASASLMVGARFGGLTVIVCLLLLTMFPRFSVARLERLSYDLIPTAVGILATLPFGNPWKAGAAGLVALVIADFVREKWLQKQTSSKDLGNLLRLQSALTPLRFASFAGGLVVLSWKGDQWWLALLAFPLFFALQKGAENAVYRLGLQAASVAVAKSQRRQGELKRSKEHLQEEVELLSSVVKCCRSLAGDLDVQAVYHRLESVLSENVPHDAGAVLELNGESLEPTHLWSAAGLQPRLEALIIVAETVLRKRGALEVPDGAKTKLPAPFEGVRSMLGFPLTKEDHPVGVVLLVHREPAKFTAERRDLLGILAVQMGITLDNTRLYAQVIEGRRKLEDSQNQIIQAEKMTAVGRLAAGVAHELNSPLAAILLSLEAIDDLHQVAPEEVPSIVAEATGAVEKSQTIVSQLLHYVRQDDTRVILDLTKVAEEAIAFLSRLLTMENFEVEFQAGGELPVLADRTKLNQILNNLILNACDASGDTRKLTVSTREDEHTCIVSVEDWGSGVPESIAAKIFDPFFTTKDVGEGTGLGLTVAKQLTDQMGGRLEFRNKSEGGTIFSVILPNRKTETPEAHSRKDP